MKRNKQTALENVGQWCVGRAITRLWGSYLLFINSKEADFFQVLSFVFQKEATLSGWVMGFVLERVAFKISARSTTEASRCCASYQSVEISISSSCPCPLLCRPLQDFGLLHRADAGDQGARSVFQTSAKGHRGERQGEFAVFVSSLKLTVRKRWGSYY